MRKSSFPWSVSFGYNLEPDVEAGRPSGGRDGSFPAFLLLLIAGLIIATDS